MSLLTEATQARELHLEVETLVRSQARSDMRLAEKLFFLKKHNLYKKAIGEGINTWVDYLKQPEVNISLHKANKLIKIYQHFDMLGYKMEEIESVPLHALAHVAEKGAVDVQQIDELLEDAKVLSQTDFKEKYHDTVESGARTYTYLIMKKCVETGSLEKVHNISSEKIVEAFNL
jgi:hypothetical protein